MELDRLKAKEADLQNGLQKTREAIKIETTRLERTLALISQAEDEYSTFTHQARLHHDASKSIPSSDAEDQQIINNVDCIHLRAVEAIQKALGLL